MLSHVINEMLISNFQILNIIMQVTEIFQKFRRYVASDKFEVSPER